MKLTRYAMCMALLLVSTTLFGQTEIAARPNIVVIWGDDIGQSDISAYTRGLMGFQTPNIDRVAGEGMLFTDYDAEQSCTAGRSTFITGQSVFRTGLSERVSTEAEGSDVHDRSGNRSPFSAGRIN